MKKTSIENRRRAVSPIVRTATVFATVHWPRYFYNRTDARRESEAVVHISRNYPARVLRGPLSNQPENSNSSISSWRPARSRFRSRALSRAWDPRAKIPPAREIPDAVADRENSLRSIITFFDVE